MHRLLEALSVKGSRVGSAAAEEERQEEGSACVSVHYCACAYRLPDVCDCVFGELHSVVCSSGD